MRMRTTGARRRRAARTATAVVLAVLALAAGRPGAGGGRTDSLAVPGAAGAGPSSQPPAAATPGAAVPGEALPEGALPDGVPPAPIEPRHVRPLTGIAPGRNDSNPAWSPDGSLIAFERSRGDGKEIVIARSDGTVAVTVKHCADAEGGIPFLLPGDPGEASYNAGIGWAPSGKRFVFMSNGGEGNYDLFLRELGGSAAVRLTDHKEKEGHAHWSPAADNIVVFVSGRTGKGDLYLMDVSTRAVTRLTPGGQPYLYPRWSPDGRRIAATHGSDGNHDIYVIDAAGTPAAGRALTTWPWDDIRPAWSPDGRKIAFYSNYNVEGDPKAWSIVVVAADGSDPKEGEGLAARVAATDVIPDVETGPAWMPDSAGIAYVKNARHEYNPIYIVDIASRTERPVATGTKMNHDVTCSAEGLLAFRAQVDQWDHMFVAMLGTKAPYR